MYRVTLCTCSIAFRYSQRGPDVTSNDTCPFWLKKSILHRNSVMATKVPDFVSTMSRTTKCYNCSKLFVNQQGLFYTVKLKTSNCIVFIDLSTHQIISILFKISALASFLKYSLNFANFSLDILIKYILKKKRV